MDLSWMWKATVTLIGLAFAGIVGNAAWDGIKKGRRWLQEWSRDRAARAAASDAERAARLAGQTQRLVAWTASIVLSALTLLCLIIATLLFSMYVEPGLQRLILHGAAAALIITLAVFLTTAIRILDQVLDHIRQQDDQDPPAPPTGPLPPAPVQPEARPAPVPEEQRR